MSKFKELSTIVSSIRFCTKCDLWLNRNKSVIGEGDFNTSIMIVGEGPGDNEDKKGRPFVGRQGELLNKVLLKAGLSRKDIYITTITKCRTLDGGTPTEDQMKCCFPYLREQVRVIQPKLIVTLGSVATRAILNQKDAKIASLRGKLQTIETKGGGVINVFPTFHPSYILRNKTQDNLKSYVIDFMKVKKFVEKSN